MKTNKLFLPLFIIIFAACAVWVWKLSQQPTTQKPKPLTLSPISLAMDWTPNTNHTGIYVAQKKGWYKDEGIELKILPSSSVSSDLLVNTGKADLGISSTESIVADAGVDAPVISIAAIIAKNTSALVALNESGITRPRELEGKTYGGWGAPFEAPVITEMIKHDGAIGNFKNVTLSVDPMQALKSKQVDFVWIFMGWDGIAATREKIGLRIFSPTQFGIPDYSTPNIITSKQTIEKKKELLKKFMKATAKGYEFARTNPKESAQILIDTAPKGTFPDPGLVYNSQKYLSPLYADQGKKWGMQTKESWTKYPQFMIDHKAVINAAGEPVEKLDFDSLYTNEFLR